jgi:hypothetical protein
MSSSCVVMSKSPAVVAAICFAGAFLDVCVPLQIAQRYVHQLQDAALLIGKHHCVWPSLSIRLQASKCDFAVFHQGL